MTNYLLFSVLYELTHASDESHSGNYAIKYKHDLSVTHSHTPHSHTPHSNSKNNRMYDMFQYMCEKEKLTKEMEKVVKEMKIIGVYLLLLVSWIFVYAVKISIDGVETVYGIISFAVLLFFIVCWFVTILPAIAESYTVCNAKPILKKLNDRSTCVHFIMIVSHFGTFVLDIGAAWNGDPVYNSDVGIGILVCNFLFVGALGGWNIFIGLKKSNVYDILKRKRDILEKKINSYLPKARTVGVGYSPRSGNSQEKQLKNANSKQEKITIERELAEAMNTLKPITEGVEN